VRLLVTRALGAATVLAAALGIDGPAHAQLSGSETPTAVEFSNSASATPRFGMPHLGRRATTSDYLAPAPSVIAASSHPAVADGVGTSPHVFEHFFLSGIACLVRGDPAGAAGIFEVTAQVAAELPQMAYLTALAGVLSDFDHRGRMLAPIQRAITADPGHPLYTIVDVLADSNLSVLKADGALYLTPAGAQLIRAAANRLSARKDAYNGKYVTTLLAALEETGDAAMPQRLKGFSAMLGAGRPIALPDIQAPQALGRLLVLSIPPEQLARYEARFLTGATGDREASSGTEQRRSDLGSRGSFLVP
jgi:hypothetical protein